jgi:hypothetical protein
MKFISNKVIRIDRELSDLDLFTLDFIRILRKHINYVVVSGYVSILLGRARASEDIDVIIPRIDFQTFSGLLKELNGRGFYCLNAEKDADVYEYMQDNLAVRFAKKKTVIPNVELKCAKNKFDEIALEKTLTVRLGKEELIISHLELQIAFKEIVLKSPKDLEDARHIRNIAEKHLDKALITKYERMLNDFYR